MSASSSGSALVTGASSSIGTTDTVRLARRAVDVILVPARHSLLDARAGNPRIDGRFLASSPTHTQFPR